MSRQLLTLARAIKLASKVVKDDDTNVDSLIELFLATPKGDAGQQAIRTAILQVWYCQTEDFRTHFREYIGEIEETEETEEKIETDMIETNALAS